MAATLPVNIPSPTALPEDEVDFDHIYVLYFNQGGAVFPKIKHFHFKGSLREAMDRGRAHCDFLGNARFLRVEPFLHDLTEDEVNYRKSE